MPTAMNSVPPTAALEGSGLTSAGKLRRPCRHETLLPASLSLPLSALCSAEARRTPTHHSLYFVFIE